MRMVQARIDQLREDSQEVVIKRSNAEWIITRGVFKHINYNKRHLPVVIGRPDNEAYYLRMSIRRILHGYRALRTFFPPSPFLNGD